jgi:hypothetical protein
MAPEVEKEMNHEKDIGDIFSMGKTLLKVLSKIQFQKMDENDKEK